MKIRRISLSKSALLRMEPSERAFLLLAGHMQNELNSLNRVFGGCLRNRSDQKSSIESLANGAQAMIYARILAGKLWEASEALKKGLFKNRKFAQRIEAQLHPVAQDAQKKIKSYFGKTNVIYRVRNSFAFHYSVEEFGLHWRDAADDFEFVFGGTVGNNLYLAGELVANAALLKGITPKDNTDALRRFFDEIQSVASTFTDFLEGAMLVILQEQLGSALAELGTEEEIFPERCYSEVAIPFFCKADAKQDEDAQTPGELPS